jgi:hypothetical protein
MKRFITNDDLTVLVTKASTLRKLAKAKVDKRTRSKWSRALRYALRYKSHSERLEQFIKRKGC